MLLISWTPAEPPGLAWRIDEAWRGAAGGKNSWLPHAIVFAIAAIATVLVMRSC